MSYQWQTTGATAAGKKHQRHNEPNQDAFIAEPINQANSSFLIAVADGHGSAPHFRSDIGSQLAVEAAKSALEWDLNDLGEGRELIEDLVQIWRQSVQQHLSKHPIGSPGENIYFPYGTTLVMVAANADVFLALQLGDGDLVLGYEDGRMFKPLAPDEGLIGEQTYSLCLDSAEEYAKIWTIRGNQAPWPDFALVATDGVSKSFVDDEKFVDTVAQYRSIVDSAEQLVATNAALPEWLTAVSEAGSGDDATLCFATRRFT
ncbi:MAG: PP2C family serine/threonine-protein phosphatase [Pseudomonadota bacterium]